VIWREGALPRSLIPLLTTEIVLQLGTQWTCSRETGKVLRSAFSLDSTSAIRALIGDWRALSAENRLDHYWNRIARRWFPALSL
jgi:hypothetical protein